jgi:hypothetical protein
LRSPQQTYDTRTAQAETKGIAIGRRLKPTLRAQARATLGSTVVNKKTAKFTIDTLVEMLRRVGQTVKLSIR